MILISNVLALVSLERHAFNGAVGRGQPFGKKNILNSRRGFFRLCLQRHAKMINGTVKFYNTEQSFGFIKLDGEAKQVRVLGNALKKAGITALTEGQKVKFDTHTDPESGKVTVSHIEFD